MSRIDEALRIAEGGALAGASRADAPLSEHPSPLTEYKRESRDGDFAPEHQPRVVELHRPVDALPRAARVEAPRVEAPRTARPPVVPPAEPSRAPRARTLPADGDLQARLVTGAISGVSLEQYRRVAAVLHEEQAEDGLKTVMVTSALPGEGKTLTVVNLALTLSESYGRRVLLIDADLRWPSLHTVLGIANGKGLSEALREAPGPLPVTPVSATLSVMTAGTPGSSPLAGLSSARMGEIVVQCEGEFDWVLIDTSPVGVLPDAQVLTRLTGGVIFVIGAGSTPAKAVERAIAELGGPEAIIGTVLNRVDERRIHDSGYYDQYGYYGHGKR